MTFRPVNPYDTLVQQLLQNIDRTTDATMRGLEARREERLIGEERRVEQQRIDQQRSWQVADRELSRERELDDRAATLRLGQLQRAQELIGYIRPDNELYPAFQAALDALSQPSTLSGNEAWQHAVSGKYVADIDGTPTEVNVYGILSQGAQAKEQAARSDNFQDFVIQQALENALDTSARDNTRLGWINSVIGADFFTNEQKDQFLMATGVHNEEDRDRALDEGRLRDLSVVEAELRVAQAATSLGQQIEQFEWARDWNTAEYDEFQEQVQRNRVEFNNKMAMSDLEAYTSLGVIPPTVERQQALAESLNMDSVEALKATGRIQWMRFQERERLTNKSLRQSIELTGFQISGQDLANRKQQYELDRLGLFGVLEDRKAVAEWAMLAVSEGDVEVIEMMQHLADNPAYASAFDHLDLSTLHERAVEARGDADDIAADNRRARQILADQLERSEVVNREQFLTETARTFLEEDFTAGDNGTYPALEAAVRKWVDTLSASEVRGTGAENAEQLVQRLVDRSVSERVFADRAEANKRLSTLLEAPWPDDERQARIHAAAIRDAYLAAGIFDEDQVEELDALIAGMSDDSEREKNKLDAEAREINQRADLYFSQTVAAWYELTGQSGGGMDLESYQGLLDMAKATAERWTAEVNSGACSLTPDGAQFTGGDIPYNSADPQCAHAKEMQSFWNNQVSWLASMMLDATGTSMVGSAPPPGTPGLPQDASQVPTTTTPADVVSALSARGWSRDEFPWGRFYALPPELQSTVLEGIRDGGSIDMRDVAEGIEAALVELFAEGAEVGPRTMVENPLSNEQLANIMNNDAYRNASPAEKAGTLEHWSQEWVDLADRMARDQVTEEDLANAARRFGFTRPRRGLPHAGAELVEAGRTALGATARGINNALGTNMNVPPAAPGSERVPDIAALREALNVTAERISRRAPVSPQQVVPVGSGAVPSEQAQAEAGIPPATEQESALVQLSRIMGIDPATRSGSGIDASLLPAAQPTQRPAPVYPPGQPVPGLEQLGPPPPPEATPQLSIDEVAAMVPAVQEHKSFSAYAPTANLVMPALVMQESSGIHVDPSGGFHSSHRGAFGIAQLMPATASNPGFGVTPLRSHDVREHLRVGRDYLAALLSYYQGNLDKALAAYNHGAGNVNALVERYGSQWLENAPQETRNYVRDIKNRLGV